LRASLRSVLRTPSGPPCTSRGCLNMIFRIMGLTGFVGLRGCLYHDLWSLASGREVLREAHVGAKRAKHRAKRSPECADPEGGTPKLLIISILGNHLRAKDGKYNPRNSVFYRRL